MKTSCPYCKGTKLYTLADGRYECYKCKRKFSPKKLYREKLIKKAFLDGISPKECASLHQISLPTISQRYSIYRQLITIYLEEKYHNKKQSFEEYEEYLFLPRHKRGKNRYLSEGIGIMAMNYGDYVYTLLMPDFYRLYMYQFGADRVNDAISKELASYMHWHKIARLKSFNTPLKEFWFFLEEFMGKFRGVKREYFSDYLKEAEFRFNFTKEEQEEILHRITSHSKIL